MTKKEKKSISTLLNHKKAIEYISKQATDVLYYCYKNEKGFPRNCDVVAVILTIMFYKNENIRNNFDVAYIRGHFRNTQVANTCFQYYSVRRPKQTRAVSTECIFCGCDYMVAHSWIELVDKETKESFIVDFTSSQFNKCVGDLEQYVLSNDLNKEELFNYVKDYSNFFINRRDPDFYYICDERFLTAKKLFDIVRDKYLNEKETDISTILTKMNCLDLLEV